MNRQLPMNSRATLVFATVVAVDVFLTLVIIKGVDSGELHHRLGHQFQDETEDDRVVLTHARDGYLRSQNGAEDGKEIQAAVGRRAEGGRKKHLHHRTGHQLKQDADVSSTAMPNAFTFDSQGAYFVVKQKLYTTFSITVRLRTTQADGLLMYSGGGSGGDYFVLELVAGHVHYVYDTGTGTRHIALDRPEDPNLADNTWHTLSVLRPDVRRHVLQVDDVTAEDLLAGESRAFHYDMDDNVYVGGVEKHMYHSLPPASKARKGIQGCLAALTFNEEVINLVNQQVHVPPEFKSAIRDGCRGPERVCSNDTCQNGGVCQQDWHGVTCDCDMTSFTGSTCADEGTAYSFGPRGGLITYMIPRNKRPSTNRDTFALGLVTSQRDAVLFRVDSGNSKDYIEAEIVDGNVLVVYNMGVIDHPIGELFEGVNDSRYHVIRFQRSGANATIQLDSYAVQMKFPKGQQLSIFNSQAEIQIGGKRDAGGRVYRPFRGIISGLTFNGLRLMELAAVGDPSISITGDVELHIGSSVLARPASEGAVDNLIVASEDCSDGQGQGHECQQFLSEHSDDLITINPPRTEFGETSGSGPCLRDCDLDFSSEDETDTPNTLVINQQRSHGNNNVNVSSDADGRSAGNDKTQGVSDGRAPSSTKVNEAEGDSGVTGVDKDAEIPGVNTGDKQYNQLHDDVILPNAANQGVQIDKKLASSYDVVTLRSLTSISFATLSSAAQPQPTVELTPPHAHNTIGDGKQSLLKSAALIGGVAVGVMLLLLLIVYIICRYRATDEGSYKVGDSKQYTYSTCNLRPPPSPLSNSHSHHNGTSTPAQQQQRAKRRDVQEWYV